MNDIGVKFKFKMGKRFSLDGGNTIYTAAKRGPSWHVTWEGCYKGAIYTTADVRENLKNEMWELVAVVNPDATAVLARINALQLKGVQVLFDKDMTVNIRGMQGGTLVGILGLCRTTEELETALTRAEKEFGVS